MLLGKDRCRHKDGHLFAVRNCLKSSPDGHLSFPVANIAAQEAVHRPLFFHIQLDFMDGPQLILCFLVREGQLEFALHVPVRRECITFRRFPLGVQFDQIVRYILNRAFNLLLDTLPVIAAKLIDLRLFAFRPYILLDKINLIDRNIQLIAA
ncbi:Uncharacterised protein [Mycobacteroides abscessus subsp. abscessus]|nr:Uncharacterised protein [Mycobacteroides abscessus subsp. abscessus]